MEKNLRRIVTLQRLQKKGYELFYRQGYNNTSVDEILDALELSKGAFYHHFKSKDKFLESIIKELISKKIYASLIADLERRKNPLMVIPDCLEYDLTMCEEDPNDNGFVITKFMAELQGNNNDMVVLLNQILEEWKVHLVNAIQWGKTNGFVSRHIDSESSATYIISSYIGIRNLMALGNKRLLKYQYLDQMKHYFNVIRA
ncbi:MAG: TetR/AcrR family transcriptional regulator [Flavobacteriaceae bacterium]|nr:TetR/AcrR family transcriptional regulator [Flavobacteriaceae bacterium]